MTSIELVTFDISNTDFCGGEFVRLIHIWKVLLNYENISNDFIIFISKLNGKLQVLVGI